MIKYSVHFSGLPDYSNWYKHLEKHQTVRFSRPQSLGNSIWQFPIYKGKDARSLLVDTEALSMTCYHHFKNCASQTLPILYLKTTSVVQWIEKAQERDWVWFLRKWKKSLSELYLESKRPYVLAIRPPQSSVLLYCNIYILLGGLFSESYFSMIWLLKQAREGQKCPGSKGHFQQLQRNCIRGILSSHW